MGNSLSVVVAIAVPVTGTAYLVKAPEIHAFEVPCVRVGCLIGF